MNSMFYGCRLLSSINLSNFDTSKVTRMRAMFYNCQKLEYINLKNFIENVSLNVENIFLHASDNVVLCLNENSIKIKRQMKPTYIINCSECANIKGKKEINKRDICYNNNNGILYKYEYNGKYYENCLNGYLINESPITKCKCDNRICYSCFNVSDEYFEIENDTNINGYIKCYKNPKGYYLDKTEYKYKKCYYTCKECEFPGDNLTHNCSICIDHYTFILNNNNYFNCYQSSEQITLSDIISYTSIITTENRATSTIKEITKDISMTENNKITIITKLTTFITIEDKFNTSILMEKDDNITSSLIGEIKYEIKYSIKDKVKIEKNETMIKTKEEEIEYYNKILKLMESEFISENYDISYLDSGKDEIIEAGKLKVIFTTIENQKNNHNMTIVDLGECEILLRNFYNLTNNETLYIKILNIIQKEMRIPKIMYDIYGKLNSSKLTKLNLTICQNSKISLIIPVKVTDNIDILNSSSGYYSDICYTTTSESGTDISLKDRKNDYIKKTVCQEDCNISSYNYITERANCSCFVKQAPTSLAELNINTKKLLENIRNIKNIANLKFLVCYKCLFCKKGLLKNIGSYIIIAIILFHIINIFLFYIKQLKSIKMIIKDLIYAINNLNLVKKKNKEKQPNKKENNSENEIQLNDRNNSDNINNEVNKGINKSKNKNKNKASNKKKKKVKKRNKKKSLKKKRKNIEINDDNEEADDNDNDNDINNNINNILNINRNKKRNSNNNNILTQRNTKLKAQKTKERVKTIMEYVDDEINELTYDLALQYDTRSYCKYYISLLRTKHSFISSFFYNKDYNSRIIKIDLFLVGFTIDYAVNALFYSDDTMHNIYISNGSFDIEYQLPIIVYSSLISMGLNTLLNMLALSNSNILEFKQNKESKGVNKRGNELKNKLKIKFALYFIISFMLLFFFWYYLSMFCVIYKNTQYHLLKDTLVSFALSLLYPFGIYLIPGIFRIPSLSEHNNKRKCLYKFSKILQIF